jgi:hypothetical protein
MASENSPTPARRRHPSLLASRVKVKNLQCGTAFWAYFSTNSQPFFQETGQQARNVPHGRNATRKAWGARKKQTNSEGGLVVDFADIYRVKFADESPMETSSEMASFRRVLRAVFVTNFAVFLSLRTHDGPFFRQNFWLLLLF